VVQVNNSLGQKKGALRGLRYQLPPAAKVKIVAASALCDAIVDIRPVSATLRSVEADLGADDHVTRTSRSRSNFELATCGVKRPT
jgi:dTDP-4-dehydrorhamnose 3,5-epimerase-like enzyme